MGDAGVFPDKAMSSSGGCSREEGMAYPEQSLDLQSPPAAARLMEMLQERDREGTEAPQYGGARERQV